MCGRFVGSYKVADLIADLEPMVSDAGLVLDANALDASGFDNFNVAPTQPVPVFMAREEQFTLTWMRWGLVPAWSNDPKVGSKMINARAETITEKPSFRGLVGSNRCLVPMSGFYEWDRSGPTPKVPHFFSRSDGRLMLVAGLWTLSPVLDSTPTFALITRESGADVAPVHHRSPAHFTAQLALDWVTGAAPVGMLTDETVQPVLVEHRVSNEVNRVVNNHPGLIDVVVDDGPGAPDQPTLF